VNNDCEIATLDEKYLRLNGTMDSSTHEWRMKDRAKLDALLQMAEIGARHGIAFAKKAEIDPSVLAMIYERAAHQRLQGDDVSALDALRNYWRCALLGNMCWQLAHTPKAQPVDISSLGKEGGKPAKKDGKKTDATTVAKGDDKAKKDETANAVTATPAPTASTNVVVVVNPPGTATSTNEIVTPAAPNASTNTVVAVNPPVAPIATNEVAIPVAPIATNQTEHPAPPPAATNTDVAVNPPVAPIATNHPAPSPVPSVPPTAPAPPPVATASNDTNEMNIPVAPIAKVEDYAGSGSPPATNAAPVIGPIPPSNKSDNADGHGGAF
jgi:hypothetical protein